jgi:hypothetical protein
MAPLKYRSNARKYIESLDTARTTLKSLLYQGLIGQVKETAGFGNLEGFKMFKNFVKAIILSRKLTVKYIDSNLENQNIDLGVSEC